MFSKLELQSSNNSILSTMLTPFFSCQKESPIYFFDISDKILSPW